MKIFVTGATGFVGSHFVNEAHKKGHELFCLKRKNSNPKIKLDIAPTWITGALNEDVPIQSFKDVEVLVHLAAHSANVPYDTLENCLYWNLTAPLNLFNTAFEAGVRKFVIAGSCFEYGLSGDKYDFFAAAALLLPTMTYPASKAASSVAFAGWALIHGVKMKYLRIFQVYGEGELESRFWPSLRKAAMEGNDFPMTKGEQVRDFIYVKDVAKRFIRELDFSTSLQDIAFENVGTGKPQTLADFANHWWLKWGAKGKIKFGELPYRENEIMRYVPDVNIRQKTDGYTFVNDNRVHKASREFD